MLQKHINSINIMSVFHSISGEVNMWPQGTPTVFIRLAGCNLVCPFCDTPQSRNEANGNDTLFIDIIYLIRTFGYTENSRPKILITGGEPLMQAAAVDSLIGDLKLVFPLCEISIETNGSFIIDCLENQPDCWVIDAKPKSLGMDIFMVPIDTQIQAIRANPHHSPHLIFKWIVANLPEDLIPVASYVQRKGHQQRIRHAVSPIFPATAVKLWENMKVFGNFQVILNTQIHKLLSLE